MLIQFILQVHLVLREEAWCIQNQSIISLAGHHEKPVSVYLLGLCICVLETSLKQTGDLLLLAL